MIAELAALAAAQFTVDLASWFTRCRFGFWCLLCFCLGWRWSWHGFRAC